MRIEREISKIMALANGKEIIQFQEMQKSNGIKESKQFMDLYILRKLAEYYKDKDLKSLDRNELINFLNSMEIKESSKNQYKAVIKKFYRVTSGMTRGEGFPDNVKFIEIVRHTDKKTRFEDLPTYDEFSRLLRATKLTRQKEKNRCLLTFMLSSGARISEILNIKIGDLNFRDKKLIVKIRISKTGERTIFLNRYLDEIKKWLEVHPRPEDKEAYLFCRSNGENAYKMINKNRVNEFLNYIADLAKVNKHLSPHTFRHLSATLDASVMGLTSEFYQKFGWEIGSRTPSVYVQLASSYDQLGELRKWNWKAVKLEFEEPVVEIEKIKIELEDKFMKAMSEMAARFALSMSNPKAVRDLRYNNEMLKKAGIESMFEVS